MPLIDAATAQRREYDLCVVGAGPAGIALALRSCANDLRVLLIDRGSAAGPSEGPSAEIADGAPHAPLETACCAGLGGTTHWWGGRATPLDPEDFERRSPDGRLLWPISYAEYAQWLPDAAAFLDCAPVFEGPPAPGWEDLDGASTTLLERLCPMTDVATRRRADLLGDEGPDVLADAAAVALEIERLDGGGAHVRAVTIAAPGGRVSIGARAVALAAGGVETTRLLLNAQAADPSLFGGADGPLGRGYMGHLAGSIAEIAFADRPSGVRAAFGYMRDGRRGETRRRFTLTDDGAPNIAFWIENLDLQDAAHGSGILSLKHMLLRVKSLAALFAPDRWREQRLREPSSAMWRHAVNILREPFRTAAAAVEVARRRVAWTGRRPDLLARTRAGRYRLAYHAEQAPNDASRVMLGGSRDPFGARAARIDFRYSAEDFAGVVAAHRRLASILSAHGGARLIFDGDDAQLAEQVAAQACDGYHQIGVTRMAADPAFGVVDAESRVFGVANLYIASSSVFPTSGQANPTLSIVAFSFRLAEGLRRKLAPFHARQGRGPSEQAGRFASPPAAAAAAARRA